MNTGTPPSSIPLVVICSCPLYPGRLAKRAAQNLAGQGKVVMVDPSTAAGHQLIRQAIDNDLPAIAVDGCPENCLRKELTGHGLEVEFYLNLSDLAIEEKQNQPLDPEDLELVEDAILAGATRTRDPFPRFNCGCCG